MIEQLSLWKPDLHPDQVVQEGVIVPRWLQWRQSALDANPPLAPRSRVVVPEGVTGFLGFVQYDEAQQIWFASVFTDDPLPNGSHYRVYVATSLTVLATHDLEP